MTIQLGQIAAGFEQDTTQGRILPSISGEDAKQRFPQGWNTKKPYLRYGELAGGKG